MRIISVLASMLFVLVQFYGEWATAQTNPSADFVSFCNSFPRIAAPYSYKPDGGDSFDKTMTDALAKRYFNIKEDDLKYNDPLYNVDEDRKTDNWMKTQPYYYGRFMVGDIVVLVYSIDYYSGQSVEMRTYNAVLCTFSKAGELIDSITVERQVTREDDCLAVAYLSDGRFQLFDYKVNMTNIDKARFAKSGLIYWLDEKAPKTVVQISEFTIGADGRIKQSKETEELLLKDDVADYRRHRPNSDDPMNKYVSK